MRYRLKIAPDAADNIKAPIPHEIKVELQRWLLQVAESPTEYSSPSTFPFVRDEQVAERSFFHGPHKYFFRASFQISQDETTLLVAHLGLVRYDVP